jgi:flagellar hook-associated protein 1 FlgK
VADTSSPASQLTGTRDRADLTAAAVSGAGGVAYVQLEDAGGNRQTAAIDLTGAGSLADIEAAIDAAPGLSASLGPQPDDTFVIQADPGLAIVGVADGLADGSNKATITQPDGAGHSLSYGLSHFFGFNDFTRAAEGDATALAVRPDLVADPQKIASAKLDVEAGPPPSGSLGGVGDSRGLGELASALDARMASVGRGGLPDATVSARGYLGDVTSIQAMHAAGAERAAENDSVLAEELDFQKAGISGVNLDEEMAHLLELQQAYATSARLLTTADEMLQDLLNAKR